MSGRIHEISGVKNLRDMGGYTNQNGAPLAEGRLFRSGHFADLTEETAAQVNALGITTAIDFRSTSETDRQPAPSLKNWQPRYFANPIGGNAAAWVRELYESLSKTAFPAKELRDQFILAFETIPIANAAGLKRMFDILVDDDDGGAAVFHCTAGKDRTGIAGALIMTTLEMPEDVIFEDFLKTNKAVDLEATSTHYAELMSERAGISINPNDVLPLVGVEPDFLKAAFAVMAKEYGSVQDYLTNGMGLTPERRKKLQTRFLDN